MDSMYIFLLLKHEELGDFGAWKTSRVSFWILEGTWEKRTTVLAKICNYTIIHVFRFSRLGEHKREKVVMKSCIYPADSLSIVSIYIGLICKCIPFQSPKSLHSHTDKEADSR